MSKSQQAQRGQARTQQPERRQIEMQLLSLDQWLDAEHRVRVVWQYVDSLDLTELYEPIRAVEGHAGRDPIDPRILFGLWLFATLEGLTSARRIADANLPAADDGSVRIDPPSIDQHRAATAATACYGPINKYVPETNCATGSGATPGSANLSASAITSFV